MKLQHLLAASLLALAGTGVHAATYMAISPGTYDGVSVLNTLYDGQSTSVYHDNVSGTGKAFSDTWTLEVNEAPGAANVRVHFSDIPLTFSGMNFDIQNMSASGSPNPPLEITGSNDSWGFSGALTNAVYNITVSGTAMGVGDTGVGITGGGWYNASLNAAPVPIPPAALLFGSALVGLAALRRKKAAEKMAD